jgi:hypothetical protein
LPAVAAAAPASPTALRPLWLLLLFHPLLMLPLQHDAR